MSSTLTGNFCQNLSLEIVARESVLCRARLCLFGEKLGVGSGKGDPTRAATGSAGGRRPERPRDAGPEV